MIRGKKLTVLFGTLLLIVVLVACERGYKSQNKIEPEPLNVENVKQCNFGNVTVYADGIKDFSYMGRVEIINDGKDGQEIEIYLYATDRVFLED